MSVLILSIGLTVLLVATSRCVKAIRITHDYENAQWALNMGQLEYPLVRTNDIADQATGPHTFGEYRFSREVEMDDDEDGLHVVRSRVTWDVHGTVKKEEVVEYVYQTPDKDS